MKKKIIYKGKSYESYSALARTYNICPAKFFDRRYAGHRIEKCLGIKEIDYKTKPKKILRYKSIAVGAHARNINKGTVYSRKQNGWSDKEALEIVPPPSNVEMVIGKVYKITNMCNHKLYIGITRQTLDERLEQHKIDAFKKNKKVKKGLPEAIRNYGKKVFRIELITTTNYNGELRALEKKYIKKFNTLFPIGYNLNYGGVWGNQKGNKIKIYGKKFDSYSDGCRYYGRNKGAFQYLIDTGRTPEQAMGLERFQKKISKAKKVIIDGKEFDTVSDAAMHYGNDPHRARCRILEGWSVEKAIKLQKVNLSQKVKVNGKEFKSRGIAAKELGITKDKIRYWIKKTGNDNIDIEIKNPNSKL